MKTTHRRSFLSGVSILALSGVIVKIIGLLYRIPLLGHLGTEGMGYFNTAYELYALFCVISTAGLPVAMSVLISAHEADGNLQHARRVYHVARNAFLLIGLVGMALLWGLARPFASLLGNPPAAVCMRAIAPTVLFICLSSAYRGYFQGHRHMQPTAISQIMEAAGKLVLGLCFAAMARARGADLPTAAAWAVAGLTVGTALSVFYLALHRRIFARRTEACADTLKRGIETAPAPSTRRVLRELARVAIPVTLSAGLISLTKCVDLALILHRLQACGYTAAEANSLYGCYSTLAVPIFNLLPSLTTSVAVSVVPALSAGVSRGEAGRPDIRRTATTAWGLTLLLSIPAALGLSVFSGDILGLIFAGQPAAVAEATPWLSILGLSVPAACLTTVSGAMLQASGRAGRPILSMLGGVAAKVTLAYILLGDSSFGMLAAPISSLLCDTVIVLLNLVAIRRTAPDMLPTPKMAAALLFFPLAVAGASVGIVCRIRESAVWAELSAFVATLGTVALVALLYGMGILVPLIICQHRAAIATRDESIT